MKKIMATLAAVITCSVLFTACSGDNRTDSDLGTSGTSSGKVTSSHMATNNDNMEDNAESKAGRVGNDIRRGIDNGIGDASKIVSDVLR
ncbi:MAG: hypothetical protein GX896_07805 [Clostridiales bacterium]|nr:hypothetical protein [Clostridiales bacterium]